MADFSFDIVSEMNDPELTNALDQTTREIANRFDFRGSKSTIKRQEKDLEIFAEDETKLKNIRDIFETKCAKRQLSVLAFKFNEPEKATGSGLRQKISIVSGIDQEHAKKIVKLIKEWDKKVQASIQGDKIRVAAKSKDTLQEIIQKLKSSDAIDIPLQFNNYR